MLLVDAENDRLLEAVPAFLQEFRNLPCHEFGPVTQNQRAVKVRDVVDAICDLVTVAIKLPFFGTVAFHIAVNVDLDDLVGRQKTVANTLLKGVGINGFTEVVYVGDVLRLLRGSGKPDLCGRPKVFQDLAPG